MRIKLLLLLFIVLLFSCGRTEYSEIKEETAEVIQLSYVPAKTETVSGTSINTSGDIGFVNATSTIPEIWAVVFRCSEHNKTFALNSKELYDNVKEGLIVKLNYVEEYYIKEKDEQIIEKKLIDFHTVSMEINGRRIIRKKYGHLLNKNDRF